MEPIPEIAPFLALAETRSAMIALVQGDKIKYMNPAGCEMMGRSREEIVGRNFWDFVHPEHQEAVRSRGRARQAGVALPRRVEDRLVRPDGQDVWMDYTVDVIELAGQAVTLVNGHDVTANRRMQAELRQSEERFRAAFHNASIGKCITSLELGIIQVNPAFCRMVGYTEHELLALDHAILAITHPDDRELGRESIAAIMAGTERSMQVVKRYVHKLGHTVWGVLTTTLVRDAQGKALYFVSEIEDITERKRAEEALRASEERFRNLSLQAPVIMAGMDRDGRVREVSDYWLRRFGYQRAEVVGRLGREFITADSHRRILEGFAAREQSQDTAVRNIPIQGICKDGTLVDMLCTSVVEFDDRGEPRGVIAVNVDTSELNRADEALRRSEARFRNLFRDCPVTMCTVDEDNRIRDVNDCWTATFGYTRDEVIGQRGLDFVNSEDRARLEGGGPGHWPEWTRSMRNHPVQGIRKDGSLVDLLVTTVPEEDEQGVTRGLICVCIDVTVLRENEARYRALVEYAPEAIVVADADSRLFVDANARAEALFGMGREQLLTRDVLNTSPPAQQNGRPSTEYAAEVIRRALDGESPVFEWSHLGADGREVPCRIHLTRFPAAGRNLVRATITDISGEKRLQEQMRHQEKMAAMGILAAGVAHEIGNPLQSLSMAAQSLERRSQDPYAQRKLGLIREHIDRIARIVRQMNDLARPQSVERTRIDLNRTVERAIEVARFDRRANGVQVQLALAPLPLLVVAEDQLTQVCLNLALNAFDAMSGNPAGQERVLTVASVVDGAWVRVTFDDTGPGIPAEQQARLFQPFFTTKASGKGTGLGLTVSHRIVQEHGGTLTFAPRAGGGARFTIALPRTPSA